MLSKYAPLAKETDIRCWACWESNETPSNRLIRACSGCKDRDLQFIHQDCIEKFIMNLVCSRHPAGIVEEPVPFLSRETIDEIGRHFLAALPSKIKPDDPAYPTAWVNAYNELNSRLSLNYMNIRCSRCLDAYNIRLKPMSWFSVLLSDKVLRLLVFLMTMSMLVLVFACGAIVSQANAFEAANEHTSDDAWRVHLMIHSWIFQDQIDIRYWAALILATFSIAYLVTMGVVWRHSRGYSKIIVSDKHL